MTQEEFDSWFEHPVTEAVLRWVEGKREELKDLWAGGAFTGPSLEETAIKNVAATGAASAYQEILELEFDQLREVEDESGKSHWSGPTGAGSVGGVLRAGDEEEYDSHPGERE